MRISRTALVVSFLVVLLSFSSAHANDVVNSGFETGNFGWWNQWNSANATINNWGNTGSYSAAAWWAASGWQDVTISDPSSALKVGGYMFDDVAGNESLRNGSYASIRVEFKDSSSNIVGTWTTGNLTGSDLTDNTWNEKTAVVTPLSYGAGIDHATIVWEVNNSGSGDGRGIFDDLIVETTTVPEPASMLLLASGLMGVGLLGKRKK